MSLSQTLHCILIITFELRYNSFSDLFTYCSRLCESQYGVLAPLSISSEMIELGDNGSKGSPSEAVSRPSRFETNIVWRLSSTIFGQVLLANAPTCRFSSLGRFVPWSISFSLVCDDLPWVNQYETIRYELSHVIGKSEFIDNLLSVIFY